MFDDLNLQSDYCQKTSPLYATLFETLTGYCKAHNAGTTDPDLIAFFETANACWQGRTFIAWFERPLLLAGALHQQVLQGHAPLLASFYASAGGSFTRQQSASFARALKTTLGQRHQAMAAFISQDTIQTNETSRGLTWLLPLLEHWAGKRPAVSLIELGCSAGLGLVADCYGYQVALQGGLQWSQGGSPDFDINLKGGGAAAAMTSLAHMQGLSSAIRRRIGCDLRTLDCQNNTQKHILEAFIWGDNLPRLNRLHAAMATQQKNTVDFEDGDMVDCVRRLAARPFADTPMICLFNTVATCYLDNAHYARLRETISAAFHDQWADKDCLWIELEMPREGEAVPDYATDAECLIRVHTRDQHGGLTIRYFGAASAHPTEIMIY